MINRAVAGVGAMVFVAVVLAPTAAQATTYRYWTYWTGGQSWTYSQRGPGFLVPTDAAVEGWRFAVSAQDGSSADPPASPSTYEQLCPNQPAAPAGRKRVAVVIDFGDPAIAPNGETQPANSTSCVLAPARATGLQVLQQVAQLRFHSSGLLCAIAGFPDKECPGQSANAVKTPAKPTRPSGTPTGPANPARPVKPPNPALPAPATSREPPDEQITSRTGSPTPSATPQLSSPASPTDRPSAVALALPEPAADQTTNPPGWIAAIGVTLIAVLLGLALLMRRGRP